MEMMEEAYGTIAVNASICFFAVLTLQQCSRLSRSTSKYRWYAATCSPEISKCLQQTMKRFMQQEIAFFSENSIRENMT